MNAIVVRADPAKLHARRERALTAVRLTEAELRARVEAGTAAPEERDAWQEVDTVAFLLGPLRRVDHPAVPRSLGESRP